MERLYQKRLSSLCPLPSSVPTSFFPQEIYSNRRPPADRHTPTEYRPAENWPPATRHSLDGLSAGGLTAKWN